MIVSQISKDDFVTEFIESEYNKFSVPALKGLYDLLKGYYEDSENEEVSFDVLELSLEWTEFLNEDEALQENREFRSLEDMKDFRHVIELDNDGLLVMNF